MTSADVVSVARSWLATPFVPQSSVKGHGCDCAGLVIGVAKEIGAAPDDFDPGPYKQSPNGTMLKICDAHLSRVDKASIVPGDIVAIQWDKEPQHLGIVVDYPRGRLGIVHAMNRRRAVVEHVLSDKWRALIVAAYRFREL